MNLRKLLLSGCFVLLSAIGISGAFAQHEDLFQETALVTHMHEHLARISDIKAAIIAGDLEAAGKPASWLAGHDVADDLPAGWEAYVARMRRHAASVASATDLASAAAELTAIAQACGDCHVANNKEVTFGFDQKPGDEFEDRRTHMQRHLWGVDRMWDGLIGPSDIAWNRGSDFLIDVPLAAGEILDAANSIEGIADMASRVHVLGGKGTQVKSAAERSELLGELLAVCGTCHARLQVGPAH